MLTCAFLEDVHEEATALCRRGDVSITAITLVLGFVAEEDVALGLGVFN